MFSALDDGFLLDLDPMSSSSVGGAAAASSMTGWGGENFLLFKLMIVRKGQPYLSTVATVNVFFSPGYGNATQPYF